jgi:hypothetical protein
VPSRQQPYGRTDSCGRGARPGTDSPLTIVGHLTTWSLRRRHATIKLIDAGPAVASPRVAWSAAAHTPAAKGYDAHGGGQIVNVDDPIYGPDVTYSTLTTNYRGSGT